MSYLKLSVVICNALKAKQCQKFSCNNCLRILFQFPLGMFFYNGLYTGFAPQASGCANELSDIANVSVLYPISNPAGKSTIPAAFVRKSIP